MDALARAIKLEDEADGVRDHDQATLRYQAAQVNALIALVEQMAAATEQLRRIAIILNKMELKKENS